MKRILFITFLTIQMALCKTAMSQTLNFATLDSVRHIANASLGFDYSISYGIGYGYKLNTKFPVVLTVNFSMPSGEEILDDFKTKIGGQVSLPRESNFIGSVSIYGIYRKYQSELVRLQNFGSEVKGTFGYYKSKWFLAGEIGFDKAIVTHFKHSDDYKDTYLSNVKDGWYEPSTGGNFHYGIQTGYSFNKTDITLNIGMLTTQDFKTTPLIPYYLMLGYNHRIN